MEPIDAAMIVLKMGNMPNGMSMPQQGQGGQGGGSPSVVAEQNDLREYLQEALKQVTDKRKKRSNYQKIRDGVRDWEEDGKVYDYYAQNHGPWWRRFLDGGGDE